MTGICKGAPRVAALILPLFFIILSGCASLWEREVYLRTQHIAHEDDFLSGSALTVNSPDALKSAIIGVIRGGKAEEDIRVIDYPGGLTRLDVSRLLSEIQNQEPIGAFTVDYMSFELNHILSQYIITLNIVYKHGVRPPILPAGGRRELEEAVRSALAQRLSALIVEMRIFDARDHDAERAVRAFYYSNPGWAMEYPGVNINLFPPAGSSPGRIIELELDWQTPHAELTRRSRDTEGRAELLLYDMPGFSGSMEEIDAQAVLWLYETLISAVRYDEDPVRGVSHTAYGALVRGQAAGEGYAMAFKLLCDMLEIDSLVITGYYRGGEYAWNLVRLGGHWYHISIAPGYFLISDDDETMEAFHWDKSLYPPATPGPWTVEGIIELEFTGELE